MNPSLASLVTGGGRGIGRAVALRLARETAVLIVGRTSSDLETTCAEIQQAGGVAAFCVGDVSDPATADRAVRLARERGWTLRNLVCNAGQGASGHTETFDRQKWQEIFAVNVHGSFYFVQACLPVMLEQRQGTICLMSSILGVKGYKYQAAYTASKQALVGLARALAHEYGKHGIVTVPLCPGFVESDMTRRTIGGIMKHQQLTEAEAEQKVANASPQRRILPAAEVAEAVALVCSGLIPALSGNPLILSGGE
jgi:NAD(P)-dependent dehydrogenase (short-subunit alcohol dehydrogenase family)